MTNGRQKKREEAVRLDYTSTIPGQIISDPALEGPMMGVENGGKSQPQLAHLLSV